MTPLAPSQLPCSRTSGGPPEFALVCPQAVTTERLSPVLAGVGTLSPLWGNTEQCVQQLCSTPYALAFLDFSTPQLGQAARVAQRLAVSRPSLALVAVGNAANAESVLTALRAGVSDFIDLDNAEVEGLAIVQKALSVHDTAWGGAAPMHRGKLLVLLGARAGVGTSCAAINLTALAQRALGTQGHAMLLDFGIPVADASLYLGQKREFDLLEAIASIGRIDHTFIASAFAHHPAGFSLLPMPSQAERMREIAYDDALALLELLRKYFPLQVADLGGCSDPDFVAAVVQQADEVLMVSDPSVGAIASARTLLHALSERGVQANKLKLVVSKHDPALALGMADMAKRLGLQPLAELPHCHLAMLQAMNRGQSLAESSPEAAYTTAVAGIWQRLAWWSATKADAERINTGLVQGLRRLVRRDKQHA